MKVQEEEDQLCGSGRLESDGARRVWAAADDRPGRRYEPLSWPVFSQKTWCQDSLRRRL